MTSGRMTPAQVLELLKELYEREVEGWFNHPNPWIRQWIDHPCLGHLRTALHEQRPHGQPMGGYLQPHMVSESTV